MKKHPLAVVFTDTHLKENTIEINDHIYLQIEDVCEELNIQYAFHAGDIFTSRKSQPLSVLKSFYRMAKRMASRDIEFTIIPGNHDKVDYTSVDSYLDIFEPVANIIPTPGYIDFDGIRIHFVPYFDEELTYKDVLSQVVTDHYKEDVKNVLITHCAIDGVKNNDGTTVENNLAKELFDCFDLVLVGHYHNFQQYDNIWYIGSTHQANFGEDDDKGCWILYNDATIEFRALDFPKYITDKIDASDLSFEEIDDFVQSLPKGNNNRVVIESDGTKEITAFKKRLEESGIKVEVNKKDSIIEPEQAKESYTPITKEEIFDDFEEWAVERKPKNLKYGREQLKSAS